MKNRLSDLNDHLFAQIERLGDESISAEDLSREIERARAITSVSAQIIANGALALKAEEFKCEAFSVKEVRIPKFLESGGG